MNLCIFFSEDYPEALKLKEEAFKVFLNSCLQEEAPEDVENKVLNYIKGEKSCKKNKTFYFCTPHYLHYNKALDVFFFNETNSSAA